MSQSIVSKNHNGFQRRVICGDAFDYLNKIDSIDGVITSLPDWDETNLSTPKDWSNWFILIVKMILEKLPDNGYAFFYQSDRKYEGKLIDKSYLCNEAARQAGVPLLWHKIAIKREVECIDLFRPTFTHLLLFGKGKPGKAIPDLFYTGKMIYKNAMGLNACKICCDFFRGKSNTITDPFCGQGSVLAIANAYGFNSIGVEILPEFARKSTNLEILTH